MGFFKNISLDVRAQAITKAFTSLREEQFACILDNIEHVLKRAVPQDKRTLGGEADLSLRSFQYWILMTLTRERSYVLPKDLDVFNGMAMHYGWGQPYEAVGDRIVELNSYANDAAKQVVQVSIPVADFLLGDKDPRVWNIIGQTIAVFSLQTSYVIASEFGDKQGAKTLQTNLENLCSIYEKPH